MRYSKRNCYSDVYQIRETNIFCITACMDGTNLKQNYDCYDSHSCVVEICVLNFFLSVYVKLIFGEIFERKIVKFFKR